MFSTPAHPTFHSFPPLKLLLLMSWSFFWQPPHGSIHNTGLAPFQIYFPSLNFWAACCAIFTSIDDRTNKKKTLRRKLILRDTKQQKKIKKFKNYSNRNRKEGNLGFYCKENCVVNGIITKRKRDTNLFAKKKKAKKVIKNYQTLFIRKFINSRAQYIAQHMRPLAITNR